MFLSSTHSSIRTRIWKALLFYNLSYLKHFYHLVQARPLLQSWYWPCNRQEMIAFVLHSWSRGIAIPEGWNFLLYCTKSGHIDLKFIRTKPGTMEHSWSDQKQLGWPRKRKLAILLTCKYGRYNFFLLTKFLCLSDWLLPERNKLIQVFIYLAFKVALLTKKLDYGFLACNSTFHLRVFGVS